jgi:hypothetical protein
VSRAGVGLKGKEILKNDVGRGKENAGVVRRGKQEGMRGRKIRKCKYNIRGRMLRRKTKKTW